MNNKQSIKALNKPLSELTGTAIQDLIMLRKTVEKTGILKREELINMVDIKSLVTQINLVFEKQVLLKNGIIADPVQIQKYKKVFNKTPDACFFVNGRWQTFDVTVSYFNKSDAESKRMNKSKKYINCTVFVIHPTSTEFSFLTEEQVQVYNLTAEILKKEVRSTAKRQYQIELIKKFNIPEDIKKELDDFSKWDNKELSEYVEELIPLLEQTYHNVKNNVTDNIEMGETLKNKFVDPKRKDEMDDVIKHPELAQKKYGQSNLHYFPVFAEIAPFVVKNDDIDCDERDYGFIKAICDIELDEKLKNTLKEIREMNRLRGVAKRNPKILKDTKYQKLEVLEEEITESVKYLNMNSKKLKCTNRGGTFVEGEEGIFDGTYLKETMNKATIKDEEVLNFLTGKMEKELNFQKQTQLCAHNFNPLLKQALDGKCKPFPRSEINIEESYNEQSLMSYFQELYNVSKENVDKILESNLVRGNLWESLHVREISWFSEKFRNGSRVPNYTIAKSDLTNCYYVISPERKLETGSIRVIFKGSWEQKPLNLKYKPFKIGGEQFWISKSFTLNKEWVKTWNQQLGNIIGSQAAFMSTGSDMSQSLWLNSLYSRHNQQIINMLDVNYIMCKNALGTINLGKKEFFDKLSEFKCNDVVIANYLHHLISDYPDLIKYGNRCLKNALADSKKLYGLGFNLFKEQSFLNIMYLKNSKPKNIFEDPRKLLGGFYKREETFNESYRGSPFEDFKGEATTKQFEKALFKEDGSFTNKTLYFPGLINSVVKHMSDNPGKWTQDPTVYTEMDGGAFETSTASATRMPHKGETKLGKNIKSVPTQEALFMNEEIIRKRLMDKLSTKTDPLTMFEMMIEDLAFYDNTVILTIALKEQIGGKRIFFIQMLYNRNSNKWLDEMCVSFLKNRDDDLIAKEGVSKLQHINDVLRKLAPGSYAGISMDKTKYGDKYMVECFTELAKALYRVGYLVRDEAELMIYILQGLKKRIILTPPEVLEIMTSVEKQGNVSIAKQNRYSSSLKRKMEHITTIVGMEKINHVNNTREEITRNKKSVLGQLTEKFAGKLTDNGIFENKHFIYKKVGFTLGVLNYASTILSCGINVIKTEICKYLGIPPGQGFYHSDDSSEFTPGRCPTLAQIRNSNIIFKRNCYLNSKAVQEMSPFIVTCILYLGSYCMGQIPSPLKWMITDGITEILQTITYVLVEKHDKSLVVVARNSVPLIRYFCTLGVPGTRQSPTGEFNSRLGMVYDMVANGGEAIACTMAQIILCNLISVEFNFKGLVMKNAYPTQVGGAWINIPYLIKRYGMRCNLYRLILGANKHIINNLMNLKFGETKETVSLTDFYSDVLADFQIHYAYRKSVDKNIINILHIDEDTNLTDVLENIRQRHGYKEILGLSDKNNYKITLIKKHLSPSFGLKRAKIGGNYVEAMCINYGNLLTNVRFFERSFTCKIKEAQLFLITEKRPETLEFKMLLQTDSVQIEDFKGLRFFISDLEYKKKPLLKTDYDTTILPFTAIYDWSIIRCILAAMWFDNTSDILKISLGNNEVIKLYPGIVNEVYKPIWELVRKLIGTKNLRKQITEKKDLIEALINGKDVKTITKGALEVEQLGIWINGTGPKIIVGEVTEVENIYKKPELVIDDISKLDRSSIGLFCSIDLICLKLGIDRNTIMGAQIGGVFAENTQETLVKCYKNLLIRSESAGSYASSGFLAVVHCLIIRGYMDMTIEFGETTMTIEIVIFGRGTASVNTFALKESRTGDYFLFYSQNETMSILEMVSVVRYLLYFAPNKFKNLFGKTKRLSLLDFCLSILTNHNTEGLSEKAKELGVVLNGMKGKPSLSFQPNHETNSMSVIYGELPTISEPTTMYFAHGEKSNRVWDGSFEFDPESLSLSNGEFALIPWEFKSRQVKLLNAPDVLITLLEDVTKAIETTDLKRDEVFKAFSIMCGLDKSSVICDNTTKALTILVCDSMNVDCKEFMRLYNREDANLDDYLDRNRNGTNITKVKNFSLYFQKEKVVEETNKPLGFRDLRLLLSLSGFFVSNNSWLKDKSNETSVPKLILSSSVNRNYFNLLGI